MKRINKIPQVVWMIIALVVVFTIIEPSYFSSRNFSNVLIQSIPLLILALGQTLIILTQGTDLSLGTQVSFVTVLWVFLAQKGVPMAVGAILVVGINMLIGVINGTVVSKGKIPPFIATLGMQNILYGLALLITGGSSIYFASDIYIFITETRILFILLPIWIAIAVFGLTYLVLYKTKLGTNIFAVGGNAEALTLAGAKIHITMIKTYAFVAFLAGIAGLITTCRVESGQPVVAVGWEFESVAAALLGGSSLKNGKGGIVGTVFGVIFIQLLKNGLNIVGISTLYQNALIGAIILSAIIIDEFSRRYKGGGKL